MTEESASGIGSPLLTSVDLLTLEHPPCGSLACPSEGGKKIARNLKLPAIDQASAEGEEEHPLE
jgi:hypothetical protein